MREEQVPQLLGDVLGRLAYLKRLSKAARTGFELTDNMRVRTRCNDVASHAADALGRENSPHFRRDLTQALEALGWRSVNTDGVRSWRGVVPR